MYDIFLISKTPLLLTTLRERFPFVKHAVTVNEAKQKSITKMFWVVWDDVKIVDEFKFDYKVPVWDQEYIHIFKNDDQYNGICLFPKNITVTDREIEYRFFLNKKEIDIVASKTRMYDVFTIDTYDEYLHALETSTTEMFWMTSRNIQPLNEFKFDLHFSYDNVYDRTHNHAFIHRDNGKDLYNGIFLLSKTIPLSKKEVEFRFPVDRKEWDIIASEPKMYDRFVIDTYDEYLHALETSTTEMFWMTSRNIQPVNEFKFDLHFSYDNVYDRTHNHAFRHCESNGSTSYDGIFLLSKTIPLSKKEVEFRFLVDRKEWDIIASEPKMYDRFVIDTYDEYLHAMETSTTEMFWMIPKEVAPLDEFNFDLHFAHTNIYDRQINHVFKHLFNNKETYGGIMLMSKKSQVSQREIDFRFLIEKKEYKTVASIHKPYDIVFISYTEPNAEENYLKLKKRFPNIKRVHGVKGIHNAHIEAAKLVDTHMFWVVDGDAIILDEFNFDYSVTRYEKDIVFTWRSQNPINGLVYGYGGVKLLPTHLTLAMDTSTTDMTTAISKRFRAIEVVSNITAFNTDPFNTWKSAFRECVKLASKTIQGQIDTETEERLNVWCNVADGKFAINALRGARAGKLYGEENAGNLPALSKINDFEWLELEFRRTSVLR